MYATHTIGSLKPYARGLPEPFKRRQTGEQLLPVALGGDAVVEDGDAPVVAFGADKPPDGLHQFDAGFGHGDFHKGSPAAFFYPAALGFFYGVVGHGKGQFYDDNVHAGFVWQV